jgi:putative YphP/YqiW family bacilliredoxin
MREELSSIGVQELRTPDEVDAFLYEKTGTAMLVVNSVCGCAAGMARPGVRLALEGERRPDRVASVFAGQDLEATARARAHIADIPPSSHRIEGRDARQVAGDLTQVFAEFCAMPAVT